MFLTSIRERFAERRVLADAHRVEAAAVQEVLKGVVLNANETVEKKLDALKQITDQGFIKDMIRWDGRREIRLEAISMLRPNRASEQYLLEISNTHADYETRRKAGAAAAVIGSYLDAEAAGSH